MIVIESIIKSETTAKKNDLKQGIVRFLQWVPQLLLF